MACNKEVKKAKELYEDFSGYEVDQVKDVNLRSMKVLTYLGKGFAIEYIAQKHRDRKENVYRHEFEHECEVFTNGKEIIIHGEHIKITKRGIEG
jgi:hypothetical protein